MTTTKITEIDLITNAEIQRQYLDRVDVLTRVGKLTMLPGDMFVDVKMLANFCKSDSNTVRQATTRNKELYIEAGYKVLRGNELREHKEICKVHSVPYTKTRQLGLYPRKAILLTCMLLRDSEVAKQVRSYLLNVEEVAPVEQRLTL